MHIMINRVGKGRTYFEVWTVQLVSLLQSIMKIPYKTENLYIGVSYAFGKVRKVSNLSTQLNSTQLNSTQLNSTQLNSTQLNSTQLNSTQLNSMNAMYKIREQQMQAFDEEARRTFEDEMVLHSVQFSPRLCEVIGDEQLRISLRHSIRRANQYEFTYRGSIRLYIEMMFLFGSFFDCDPVYRQMTKDLCAKDYQMDRAQRIYDRILEYRSRVIGDENINQRIALERLSYLAENPISFGVHGFESEIYKTLEGVFPQLVEYAGKENVHALIRAGRARARSYEFSSARAEAVMIVLMFTFGYGCTRDPLYPWIASTLADKKIVSPERKISRLERKAKTWLDRVNNNGAGKTVIP
ncbi:hypothetical protein AB833_15090 [Chromatiales bacterium (ex Bugula neritina AB1)]|nr:hypothetical protein AB833_15090 [Chromatiales bacterium (ex Bugula neritina AB1)]